MGTVVLGARLLLAVVFAAAGVAKLLDRRGTREALEGFGVPAFALPAGALLLPLAELVTAIALVPEPSAQWGGLAALILLLGFVGGIARALVGGQTPDCHCFGQLHSEPAGPETLIRNVALAAVAALVVIEGPGPSVTAWLGDRTGAELAAVAAGIAAAVLAVVAFALVRENRGLKRKLADAQAKLSSLPSGLPVGALAPEFALPSVSGETVTLDALRARGRPLALVFVDPGCGPCAALFPKLGRWQAVMSRDLTLVLVSSGTAAENRASARDSSAEVLLQVDSELMTAYRVMGTPSTVVVTADGRIASAPATGQVAIESLIRLTLRRHRDGVGGELALSRSVADA